MKHKLRVKTQELRTKRALCQEKEHSIDRKKVLDTQITQHR